MYSQEEKKQSKVKRSARAEIYALIDPRTNEVKYIGKANNSLKRLESHLRDYKRRNYPVYIWMRELSEIGLKPKIEVLMVTNDWVSDERLIIQHYKSIGCELLNVAKGGDEPYCSTKTRAENGAKVANMIHSDQKRKRLWYLKKELASSLTFLKKNGNKDQYNSLLKRIKDNAHIPALSGLLKFDYEA